MPIWPGTTSGRSRHRGALGEADGAVRGGVTVFDDEVPAVANLDPELLGALRQAATDAAGDGVEVYVTSGWRSPEYQDQLLREAISEYGSAEEAARWVATADTSPHVSGDAIDVGHSDATAWLSERGAKFGLCQIYGNEPWHYELRPEAIDHGCPLMYADPTHDPRMQPRRTSLPGRSPAASSSASSTARRSRPQSSPSGPSSVLGRELEHEDCALVRSHEETLVGRPQRHETWPESFDLLRACIARYARLCHTADADRHFGSCSDVERPRIPTLPWRPDVADDEIVAVAHVEERDGARPS